MRSKDLMTFAAAIQACEPHTRDKAQPHQVAQWCQQIIRLAKRHTRLCLRQCNDSTFPTDGGGGYPLLDDMEQQIRGSLKGWDCRYQVRFIRDPRGCTVKLLLPTGYLNDMANEGLCVPQ